MARTTNGRCMGLYKRAVLYNVPLKVERVSLCMNTIQNTTVEPGPSTKGLVGPLNTLLRKFARLGLLPTIFYSRIYSKG